MQNRKPPEPESVRQWKEWLRAGPPRCCHTCEHFEIDGRCAIFKMTPPDEFIQMVGKCDQWKQEIPF